ncbi:MAG: FG-GAP-like repeat-containing protein [Candidatus Nanoarchaeia archaeon]
MILKKSLIFTILIVSVIIVSSNFAIAAGAVKIATLNGTASGDMFGNGAGISSDVNGDGYADVIIGANYADPSGVTDVGIVYVFFGGPNGIQDTDAMYANITLNGTVGQIGNGISTGDINNDGYSDIIIGNSQENDNGGRVYVFFGTNYTSPVNENAVSFANITINGTLAGDQFGVSVESGDINGDGYADIIVGANGADPTGLTNAGQVFVFFGANYTSIINEDASLYANITINGTAIADGLGYHIGSGDINNDYYDDIISNAGSDVFVFFGSDISMLYTNTTNSNITLNGTQIDGNFGAFISSGDINNDGYADIIVDADGTANELNEAGQIFVFFGVNYTSIVDVEATAYANITFNGSAEENYLGYYISSGDVNNDGYDDIIASVYSDPLGLAGAGQVYIFFGADYNSIINVDSSSYSNITLNGTQAGDTFGSFVCNGDVNGDGYTEVTVGASYATDSGQAYVYAYDDIAPVVSLEPVDNSDDADGLDVVFGFTTIELHPDTCTLYFTSSLIEWHANQSVTYTNNVQTNFTSINLSDGTYTWNVECNDTAGNTAFSSSNFTLTVGAITLNAPTITEPSDTTIGIRDSITYKCESNVASSWTWTLTKPDLTTVTKTGGSTTTDTATFTGDDTNQAGTYTVKCEVENSNGNKASTSKNFQVFYSTSYGDGGVGITGEIVDEGITKEPKEKTEGIEIPGQETPSQQQEEKTTTIPTQQTKTGIGAVGVIIFLAFLAAVGIITAWFLKKKK